MAIAKWQNDTMLDQALNWIKSNCDTLYITYGSSNPTTYAEASSTYKAGSATYNSASSITGPAAGSPNGRAITMGTESSIAITVASAKQMTHVALTGSIASTDYLLYVTTIPSGSRASVSSGDKVNMSTWTITLADVTA